MLVVHVSMTYWSVQFGVKRVQDVEVQRHQLVGSLVAGEDSKFINNTKDDSMCTH